MKVIRSGELGEEELIHSLFTGLVTTRTPVSEAESQFNIAYVHFPSGVRNKFHTHTSDQVLIVTEGHGVVVTGNEKVDLFAGDIVLAPAGEKHWHGAVDGSAMTHISITGAGSQIEQLEE